MENHFNEILKKLDNLQIKIDKVQKEVNQIKNDTERMNEHISFIESIYINIQKPLHFVMNKINKNYLLE